MTNSIPLEDAAAREAALDPSRSFIVQAPAGSGKTELLVRRYLKLLGTVQKPEEILAITFTRKAAAEMRGRVLKEMAPENAPRLRIETIDALCVALTRQMPVLSRFGAAPEIIEDATALYREAALRALMELSDPAAHVLAHVDNNIDAGAALVASMLARRDQWLRKTGNPPTRGDLEKSLQAERQRLLSRARALDPRASPDFAEEVLTKDGGYRKKAPYPGVVGNEELRLALVALRRMPPERYSDAQWEVLQAIVELLPRAVAHLKLVFAERGEADFTEIAQGAVRALGEPDAPTDLLLTLDHRIRHILVDEFQDTSISQWELLERLTAGWEASDEKRGSDRTLFLVGDPMQSIYRFREAEVALFLHAQRAGLGGVKLERLTLTTNFRSDGPLVAWFNDAFRRILPEEADESSGAVPYSPSSAHPDHKGGADRPVEWHVFADRESEAKKVVELARAAGKKAAILVRRRDALAAIVPALQAAGIRYRAIEIEHLGEKQVVQDLYALARALTHLGDRVAWLSLLRAPWLGLSLNELHQICGHDRFTTIWELIKNNLFLERFTRVLAPAIANRGRGTLRDRVEGVWLALGGPACVENETDLEDAEIFLDQLEKLEHAGNIDFAALEESLDKLYALPDVHATEDDLQLLTIHKAKGLEFDTVIVPGLDLQSGRDDTPLFLWKEQVVTDPTDPHGSAGLLLAPIKATGSDDDPAYDYLRRLDRDAEDTEASRLLYVAATRAAKCLHLLACAKRDEEGAIRQPHKRSLLARAWPVAEEIFNEAGLPPTTPEPTAQAEIFKLKRLSPSYVVPVPPSPVRWTAPEQGRDEEQEIEFSWVGETARHVGTVVHRWLQRIAEDELRGWDERRVTSLAPQFTKELQRRGVPPADLKRASELVSRALTATLADERGRWTLSPHAEARSELRMRVRSATGTRTLIIDRVFQAADGVRWVVDFKTSRHEGANSEAFLDAERIRYATQLDSYAAALGGANRGLYFPLHSGWRT
ncbi:MAG TPA: UvrD-helicase domain-containing protein [Burkholderiales bacterium]|nr:UvrD-helicase domain-containing protein [Burkholderiales bacterium]